MDQLWFVAPFSWPRIAVVPTAIANARFMPRHLLPGKQRELRESVYGEPAGDLDT